MGTQLALALLVALAASFVCVMVAVRLILQQRQALVQRIPRLKAWAGRVRDKVLAIPPIAHHLYAVYERRRRRKLREGMPEALRLICIALDSGNTLPNALGYAAENCSEPLAGELKRVVWDVQAGISFEDALESLRSRTGGTEFAYLAVAMEIQHRSGGSLEEVLASVSQTVRISYETDESLRTKTTQAQTSAKIVAVMPVIVLVVLSLFSPDYFTTFFTSPIGVLLLCLAVALEIAGILLVRRMVSFDRVAA